MLNSKLPRLLVQLLYNRGISDPSEQQVFLSCDPSLSHDPMLLPDMPQALSRIFRALLSGDKIVVFGDFDADGITATIVLVEGLSAMGANVTPYLPHRADEGHGLNATALEEFRRNGVSLVITVDCGITSPVEVDRAKRMGIDVVITDHHTVSGEIPDACAVVDPKRPESRYPCPHLAGVGVAFKLLQAIGTSAGRLVVSEDAYAFVALGTIADMSPLVDENRFLVKRGLDAINSTKRPGILALLQSAGLELGRVSSNGVAWGLAPRLNSASRIEHAAIGYQLLHNSSPEEARQLAERLEGINRERQSLAELHWKRARQQVLAAQADQPLLMVYDAEFPPGICGLVAGKLVDEFRRPVAVLQVGETNARGSCRSIPGFDMISALTGCSDLFLQFGGHPGAAGFSTRTENIGQVRERLLECAREKLSGVDLSPEVLIDAEAEPYAMVGETFPLLQRLAPFGQGNPAPVFLGRNLEMLDARVVGNGGQHLKLKLRQGKVVWPAISFDSAARLSDLSRHIDIVYSAQVNHWGDKETLELSVVDFRPAS